MIRKDLLDFQYYLNRLSMFMKESYGIIEQTEIFYRQLYEVNKQLDILFNNLDIWGNDNIPSEMLDIIGAIFECYRKVTIKTIEIVNDSEVVKYKSIELNDNDFIIYIKCQIIKQNFLGTNEELRKLYSDSNTGKGLVPLYFNYVLFANDQGSLNCNIYFENYDSFSSDTSNIIDLFKGGYLTIESMGINYSRLAQKTNEIAVFAPEGGVDLPDYYKFHYLDSDVDKGGFFA